MAAKIEDPEASARLREERKDRKPMTPAVDSIGMAKTSKLKKDWRVTLGPTKRRQFVISPRLRRISESSDTDEECSSVPRRRSRYFFDSSDTDEECSSVPRRHSRQIYKSFNTDEERSPHGSYSISPNALSNMAKTSVLPSHYGQSDRMPLEVASGEIESAVVSSQWSFQPVFDCPFWFVVCDYRSTDQEEWRRHCLSHFQGMEPPRTVQCPFCHEFSCTSPNGWHSWHTRQDHIASRHSSGHSSRRIGAPDPTLLEYLQPKSLVSDCELRVLDQVDHKLESIPPDLMIATNLDEREERARQYKRTTRHSNSFTRILSKQRNPRGALKYFAPEKHDTKTTTGHSTSTSSTSVSTRRNSISRPERIMERSKPEVGGTDEEPSERTDKVPVRGWRQRHPSETQKAPNSSVFGQSESKKTITLVPNPKYKSTESSNDPTLELSQARIISGEDRYPGEFDQESHLWDSFSEESEYSDATTELQLPDNILHRLRDTYFIRVLRTFYKEQQQSHTEGLSDQDNSASSDNSDKGKHRASSPLPSRSSPSSSSKRACRQMTFRDGDQKDEEEEEDGQGKIPRKSPPDFNNGSRQKNLMFACPFVKRYPSRYSKCFSHCLRDVPRVKQHLFRDKTHRLPIYCPKCYITFDLECYRDDHVRESQCSTQPTKSWEGITEKQRQQLNKRSSSTRTPEENWYSVFQILFPGSPLPSSPYIDMSLSGELQAFRDFLLIEGPRVWNDVLTEMLPEHLRPHLEELQLLQESFYEESVERLCHVWRSQSSPDPDTAVPAIVYTADKGRADMTGYLAPPSGTASSSSSLSSSAMLYENAHVLHAPPDSTTQNSQRSIEHDTPAPSTHLFPYPFPVHSPSESHGPPTSNPISTRTNDVANTPTAVAGIENNMFAHGVSTENSYLLDLEDGFNLPEEWDSLDSFWCPGPQAQTEQHTG